MTIEAYYDSPKMLKRLHEGPLGVHIDLFAARVLREGHCRQGAWRNLRVACDFSHWLARKRLELNDINEQSIDEYQEFRRRYRCPFLSDRPALIRLLGLLREIDAIPAKPPLALDELEQIVRDFDRYLTVFLPVPISGCLQSQDHRLAGLCRGKQRTGQRSPQGSLRARSDTAQPGDSAFG